LSATAAATRSKEFIISFGMFTYVFEHGD